MLKHTIRSAVLASLALGLVACEDASDVPPATFYEIRVIHAVADAPNVDVLVDGVVAFNDLAFKDATQLSRRPNARTASVQVDALVPGGTATVIGPVDVTFEDDNAYSIIAAGSVATMIEPVVISNPTRTLDQSTVRAQVVHGSPSAPQVDVYVTAPGAILAQSVPLGTFSFKEELGPVEVPPGDYQIRVTLPGDPDTVVFDSGTIALPASDLLIVAVDNTGLGTAPISLLVADNGLGTFEILDQATPSEFRVIHASPDAPAVNVIVNDDFDNPILGSVAYPAFSDFLSVPPDTYNVKVTPDDNPGLIVIDADLILEAGRQYSVYAADVLASITPYVLVDDLRPVATEARVRIVHLAPGAGLVDIYVTVPGADITPLMPTFAGVDFQDETGYVGLAAGSYDVTVTVAGTKTAAIGPANIIIVDGGVYTAVARDAEGGAGGAPFGLILLDDFN